MSSPHPADATPTTHRKRRNDGALQACDRCRTKKTRCDPSNREDLCQPCSSASADCTYDMPLTAARSKRIRRGLERATTAVEGDVSGDQSGDDARHDDHPIAATVPRLTVRREGFTSISYILHSAPTIPLHRLTEYDQSHGYSMSAQNSPSHMLVTLDTSTLPISEDDSAMLRSLRAVSWDEVVSRLVEVYLAQVSPTMPIVVREEMMNAGSTLRHAMAAVAATRKACPKEVFVALRYILRRDIATKDIALDTTRENVQILLLTCLVDDLALQAGEAAPLSTVRLRVSTAIQMAQDLGMAEAITGSDARVWRCCGVLDKWHAARIGLGPIAQPLQSPSLTSDPFFDSLSTLSELLGRLLRLVYGVFGVTRVVDHELLSFRDDLRIWKDQLPEVLRFNGVWSSLQAGILHLAHTAITILLYRPFMRWSFICPVHFTLDLDLSVWNQLYPASRAAIEWASNRDELMDLGCLGPYALALCAFLQFHNWARRREWEGVSMLGKASQAVERWTQQMADGHIVIHLSQLHAIPLIYRLATTNAATTSYQLTDRGLDPTPGVLNRLPETSIAGVTFIRDPSLPNGGVLVATQKAAREVKDLPPGTLIIGGPPAAENGDLDVQAGLDALPGAMFEGGSVGITPDWQATLDALGISHFSTTG